MSVDENKCGYKMVRLAVGVVAHESSVLLTSDGAICLACTIYVASSLWNHTAFILLLINHTIPFQRARTEPQHASLQNISKAIPIQLYQQLSSNKV